MKVSKKFTMKSLYASSNKTSSVVLVTGVGGNDGDLWAAKLPLSFKTGVRGNKESLGNTIMRYTEIKHPVDINHETPGCVCLRWNIIKDVYQNLRQVTVHMNQAGLYMGARFEIESSQTVQD